MPHNVRRTVVIGLGGTGRDAVLNIKRKYLEVYGTDNVPTTRFVVFDTTDSQPLQTGDGGEVRLRPGEFVKMTVPNPRNVVQVNQEVREWFPVDRVPLSAIAAGAGQVRALGRLSLFANAPSVQASISQAFNDVRALRPGQDLGPFEPMGDNVLVSIVGSLSGGTGSGTFLDIAYLCRSFLSATDTQVGYLLLPDVFVGKPATFNVQPNAYGALKELDDLMSMSLSQSAGPLAFGGRTYPRNETPFDIVYLVNNQNGKGTVFQDVGELTELLGLGIFVSSGATGKVAGDIWDNLRNHVTSLGKFDGKRPSYTSFGVSELVLDINAYSERLATEVAVRTLDRTLLGVDPSGVVDEVEAFVSRNELCEHEDDQVIDALLPPGQYPRLRGPEKLTKGDVDEFVAKAIKHRERAESEAKREAGEASVALTREKAEAIRAYMREQLSQPNGLGYILAFLETLGTKLREYRQEMVDERAEYRNHLADMEGRPKALREDAEAAKGKFFGRDRLLDDLKRNLTDFADQQARHEAEAARRDAAVGLFADLVETVEREREGLAGLFAKLQTIRRALDDRLEKLRRKRSGDRPFTLDIEPPADLLRASDAVDDDDFLHWLRARGDSIHGLAGMASDDIRSMLEEFAFERPLVRDVQDLTIEDVLKEMGEEEFNRKIRDLAELADPMWRYDASYVSGAKRTELIYLFGVTNEESSVLNQDGLTEILPPTPYPPDLVSTADPNRVFCYKVEAAVPAFIVAGLHTYKQRYENPDSSFSYHVDKRWEESAPDLYPSASDDTRRTWSLANAPVFGLVEKRGAHYYVKSPKHASPLDDHWRKLDQGRTKALDALLHETQIVAEMQDTIDRRSSELGRAATASALAQYLDSLKSSKVSDSETKRLIEGEISDVEAYVKDLTSL